MNRNKELHDLVGRLERMFPHLILHYEGEIFYDSDIEDFAPPRDYNWYEFLEKLEKNGLTIVDKK